MTEENKVVDLREYIEGFMSSSSNVELPPIWDLAIGRLQTALELIVDELYDIKSELAGDNIDLEQIIAIADDYQMLAQEFSAYWYLLSGEDLEESFITKLLYAEYAPELEPIESVWDNHMNYNPVYADMYMPSNELTIDRSAVKLSAGAPTLTINTDEAGFGQIIINVSK